MRSKWQNRKCDRSLKTFRWNLCNMIFCYNLIFCRNVNYSDIYSLIDPITTSDMNILFIKYFYILIECGHTLNISLPYP